VAYLFALSKNSLKLVKLSAALRRDPANLAAMAATAAPLLLALALATLATLAVWRTIRAVTFGSSARGDGDPFLV
jgi:hypothetical protein